VKKREEENALCTLIVNVGDDKISVTWNLKLVEPNQFDWIGMFNDDTPNKNYLVYQKTGGDNSVRTMIFPKPRSPGLYQFRFFPKGGYIHIATSETIYIGPRLELNAACNSETVSFNWEVTNGEVVSSDDWFGLYRVGSSDQNYLIYTKAGDTSTKTFNIGLQQGNYEVRYFPSKCGYVHTQVSNGFTVEGVDKLHLDWEYEGARTKSVIAIPIIVSKTRERNDWIGRFKTSSTNRAYITYQYIPPTEERITFACPKEVGSYDLRYFSGSGSRYEDLIRSTSFEVHNTDSVTVEITEGLLKVSWDIFSVAQTTYDWIGLYRASEVSNRNYERSTSHYVDITKNYTLLPLPTPGHYEVRYFSSIVGKYENFRKSAVFSVEA